MVDQVMKISNNTNRRIGFRETSAEFECLFFVVAGDDNDYKFMANVWRKIKWWCSVTLDYLVYYSDIWRFKHNHSIDPVWRICRIEKKGKNNSWINSIAEYIPTQLLDDNNYCSDYVSATVDKRVPH